MNQVELLQKVNTINWWHSIRLPFEIVTPGHKSLEVLEAEFAILPPVHSKTVLDIGAWDGAFSFECEKRGAARVIALDHFVWDKAHWAGRGGFDLAHAALGSRVEPVFSNFLEADFEALGIRAD